MGDDANRDDVVLTGAAAEALYKRIYDARALDENLTEMERDIQARQYTFSGLLIQYVYGRSAITRSEFVTRVEEHCRNLKDSERPKADAPFGELISQYYATMKNGDATDYTVYLSTIDYLENSDRKEFSQRYAKNKEQVATAYLNAVRRGERLDACNLVITEEQALAQIKAADKLILIDALNTHAKWLIDCFDAVHREMPKPQVQGLGALVEAIGAPHPLCVSRPFARDLESLKRGEAPTPQANTAFYRDMQEWRKQMIAAVCVGVTHAPTVTEERLDDVLLEARVKAMESLYSAMSKESVDGILEMEKETALQSPFALFLRKQGILGISGQRLDIEMYVKQHDALQREFQYWLARNHGAEEGAAQNPESAVFSMSADERYQFYCNQFDRYCKMADIEAVTEQVQAKFVAYEKLAQHAKHQGLS